MNRHVFEIKLARPSTGSSITRQVEFTTREFIHESRLHEMAITQFFNELGCSSSDFAGKWYVYSSPAKTTK